MEWFLILITVRSWIANLDSNVKEVEGLGLRMQVTILYYGNQ